jgi:NitT/TauT family transport system permease protein
MKPFEDVTMEPTANPVSVNDSSIAVRSPRKRRRRTINRRRFNRVALPAVVIVVLFIIWEIVVRGFNIPSFVLPPPSDIFVAAWTWREPILIASWQTFTTTVIGFFCAIVFGLFAGTAIGSSALLYEAFYPVLIGFNSIPKVAAVPILVIWFGIGPVPAIVTAFLISFFPILVNVATGIATVEPELNDVLRALGASRIQILTKVGLPRAMPYFFASLKVAISVAFVGSILAETVASDTGIGHLMLVASSQFQVPLTFAGLLVTGAMGILMYAVAVIFEQRMTGWTTRRG